MNFSFAKLGTTLVNTSKSQIRGRVRTSLDPFALFPVPRTFSASGLARLPMDLTFTTPTTHIAVLKPALRILRLDPEVAPLFMAPIVQSAFLSAEDSIFSFTWTSGELSIIVSDSMLLPFEKTLALMRSGQGGIAGIPDQPLAMRNSGDLDKEDSGYSRDFVVSSDKWIAIQVFMGVCGLDVAGGISLISSSLAEKHISLLNLSTFSADLILVRENDVQKAFECIKEVVSSMPSGQSKESKSKIRSQLWKSYSRLEIHELIKKKPNIRIAEIPGKYFIASMAKKQATAAMHCLLQAMFFSNASFFSYTETEDEVSLIMREDLFPLFEKISVSDCKPLLAIKLDIPIGFEFDECGIVSAMCAPLAEAEMPFLNISTYSTDFTLVSETDLPEALSILDLSI